MNHQLIGAGAAFSLTGDRLYPKTTSGYGQALCSCGWLSEAVEYGRERKRLHAEHAEEADAGEAGAGAEAESGTYPQARRAPWPERRDEPEDAPETPDVDEDPEPEQIVPETATEASPGESYDIEWPDIEWPESYDIEWPESVARLFWPALAKDGLGYIAESRGLHRTSVESRGVLTLSGPGASALGNAVPTIFRAANEALKAWRKTSEAYGQFRPLNTKERLRDAFNSEKDFLREFCRAWAGAETLGTNPDGYAAGRALRGEDVL